MNYYNNHGQQQQPGGGYQPQPQQYGYQQPAYNGQYAAPAPPPVPGYGAPPPAASTTGYGYGGQGNSYGAGAVVPPYHQQHQPAAPSHQQQSSYSQYGHGAPPVGPPPQHGQQLFNNTNPNHIQQQQPAYPAPGLGQHHHHHQQQPYQAAPTNTALLPPIYLGAKLAADPLQPLLPLPLSLPGYDPSADVEIIKKATKGFGTDENALHKILCLRSADQIQVLVQAYKSRYGKDLVELLKKETSGNHERTLCALALGPLESDVTLLHEAIAGAGTKESMVTEILIGRHPNELVLLRAAFERRFHKSLDKEVLDDLSYKTKDAFAIALQGRWQDGGFVQHDLIERDLQDLMPAFRLGFTNEMLISSILFARSPTYLQALVPAFKQRNGKSLTNQIKQHFSGHLQDALLFAVEGGKRDGLGIWRDAKRLEAAMKGAGTQDVLLIARLVRGHWDRNRFEQIKLAYQQKYKKALASRVQGETGGHYRDCLLTMIKGA